MDNFLQPSKKAKKLKKWPNDQTILDLANNLKDQVATLELQNKKQRSSIEFSWEFKNNCGLPKNKIIRNYATFYDPNICSKPTIYDILCRVVYSYYTIYDFMQLLVVFRIETVVLQVSKCKCVYNPKTMYISHSMFELIIICLTLCFYLSDLFRPTR